MSLTIEEVVSFINQSLAAHEGSKGTSGKGPDFEAGYLQAHRDIIETFYRVQPIVEGPMCSECGDSIEEGELCDSCKEAEIVPAMLQCRPCGYYEPCKPEQVEYDDEGDAVCPCCGGIAAVISEYPVEEAIAP